MINTVQVVKPITSANLASGVAFDAFGTSLAATKHKSNTFVHEMSQIMLQNTNLVSLEGTLAFAFSGLGSKQLLGINDLVVAHCESDKQWLSQ